jgi:RNA polymerase sigma-70 factor (ECF subfamily)
METPAVTADRPECVDRPAAISTAYALLDAEFDTYYGIVFRYLVHRVFDRELAEELTAETFFQAARAAPRITPERHAVQLWLLRVATNAANSHQRKHRWRQVLLGRWAYGAGACVAALSDVDGSSEGPRVRAALEMLSPADQAVVALRYYGQSSFEDMAEILGCRPCVVRQRLSRALDRLRKRLG